MRKVIAVLLTLSFSIQPSLAKCVSLDVQNPNRKLDSTLKPYCIQVRQQIEAQWEMMDQHVGEPLEVFFKIEPDGSISDIVGVSLRHKEAQTIAGYAIKQSAPFKPLPIGQDGMCVIAKFKSEPVRYQNSGSRGVSADELAQATKTVLFVTAAAALVGFSIWALCKYGGSGSGGNTNLANSDYEWVDWPHTRRDGTFSPGYWRSRANGTMMDNFSTTGNVNPFTGKTGWINP